MKEMLELSEHVVMLVSWDASDASSPSRLITSGSCKIPVHLEYTHNAENFTIQDVTAMNISLTDFIRFQN